MCFIDDLEQDDALTEVHASVNILRGLGLSSLTLKAALMSSSVKKGAEPSTITQLDRAEIRDG
jgi:hypothetical protein